MQDAEKTPDQPGSSQLHACAPGLEVSLRQLSQRCLLQLDLAQQLFEARVLLAQLTQFLGLTTTHRPITLAPPAQRRLADTQHAAGLGRTHALTSQRLGLLQLHDNLLRRVLRKRPHGHPLCPATSSQDYSEQPSHNKRSEKPRPLQSAPTGGASLARIARDSFEFVFHYRLNSYRCNDERAIVWNTHRRMTWDSAERMRARSTGTTVRRLKPQGTTGGRQHLWALAGVVDASRGGCVARKDEALPIGRSLMCAGLDLGVRTVAESMRNLGLAGLNTHQRQSKRGGLSPSDP